MPANVLIIQLLVFKWEEINECTCGICLKNGLSIYIPSLWLWIVKSEKHNSLVYCSWVDVRWFDYIFIFSSIKHCLHSRTYDNKFECCHFKAEPIVKVEVIYSKKTKLNLLKFIYFSWLQKIWKGIVLLMSCLVFP